MGLRTRIFSLGFTPVYFIWVYAPGYLFGFTDPFICLGLRTLFYLGLRTRIFYLGLHTRLFYLGLRTLFYLGLRTCLFYLGLRTRLF